MGYSNSKKIQERKRIVGAVAIALLLFFTLLAFLGFIGLLYWLIADVGVALVANLVLRKLGSQTRP